MMIAVDALALLLFFEATVILLVVSLVLAFKVKKYRKLKLQAEAEPAESQNEPDKIRIADPAVPVPAPETVQAPAIQGDHESHKTVELLKRMMREVMSCKPVFESSPGKLSALESAFYKLEHKTTIDPAGLKQAETEAMISALKAEQETLAVKFRIWEGQFNKLVGEDSDADQSAADDLEAIVRSVMTAEKKELLSRLRSLEDALHEKTRLLDALQKKYDNLEKEYEILYRQQHNQPYS